MRPTRVSLSALGYTPPILLDWDQTPFNVSLAVSVSSGGSLTANVYYTIDSMAPEAYRPISLSRTGTTITVTNDYGLQGSGVGGNPDGGTHGLSVGDFVEIAQDATLAGFYTVASVVSATSYTLTSPTSGTYTGAPGTRVLTARLIEHSTLVGITTGHSAGNFSWPVSAAWLNVSVYSSGVATMSLLQGRQA